MLVGWFLHVSFEIIFLRRTRIFGSGCGHFWSQDLSFGKPGASTLAPWGPWDDPGAPGSTRKDILGCRLGFLKILGGFREPILKVFRTPRPQICVCFHASAQVIVFQHFFFCLWIPLPRERKGLHCVREPHLSETFSSSTKTGGDPANVGTPSGGRGFLLRSWWWGSGMLGTPFQNRIRILCREAGGGFTRHDLGFYSSVECRGVFKAHGPPDVPWL